MTENPVDQTDYLLSEQITRDYRIVARLGQGGMGDVFLAEQLRVGRRRVALKVLKRAYADNPQVVKRFDAEAATAGLIHHRNVVTIYESRLTDDGLIYVAMEYVNGRTLRDVLGEQGRMSLDDVVNVALQVCSGLAAAHKLGIVHRDIKPDNIMLTQDDEELVVKVLDFGIARLSETQSIDLHTKPGSVLGTPAYMSPEQAAGAIGDQIDARSDIYSLGMVIYEMLTGRVAFANESWLAVLHHHLYDPPAPLSQSCEGEYFHPAVDQMVMRALAKDRSKRPLTAVEFARDLESAYQQARADKVRSDKLLAGETVHSEEISEEVEPESKCLETNKLPEPAPAGVSESKPVDRISDNLLGHPSRPSGTPSHTGMGPAKIAFISLALAFCVLAAVLAWMMYGPKAVSKDQQEETAMPSPGLQQNPIQAAAQKDLLIYYVKRKEAVAGLETLSADNTVQSGERIWFEFELMKPGALYFFQEREDRSWLWLDSPANGRQEAAGSALSIPKDYFLVFGGKTGMEKFWLIYVPDQLKWSLAETIAPSRISFAGKGLAQIEPDAVTRAMAWLDRYGLRLQTEGNQDGKSVRFTLRQMGEDRRVAFHQITLNHVARR